ncbi:MAG: mechanosensitive ion channel [Paramuribaculum sp.]|nr:mechanosensitive ion channel [Paramuribaculum sp.]
MLLTQAELLGINSESVDSISASHQEKLELLKSMSFNDLVNKVANDAVEFAIHLFIAILVFYAGKFIIKRLYNLTASILAKKGAEKSLSTFILSLVKIVLYFLLIVTVIGILGINTSSFIAIFASVGVAIGMALSGTLQNFAGGVLILLLKPYKIGDYIEAQGFAGTVTEIQIFSTIICTYDNKSILIPNGGLSTGSINNWSKQEFRRVQWDVGISYGDDFAVARQAILDILSKEPLIVLPEEDSAPENDCVGEDCPEVEEVKPDNGQKGTSWLGRLFFRHRQRLKEREERQAAALEELKLRPVANPSVNLMELGDSSVNLVVRAWVRSADYWVVYFNILEAIYTELPKSGVSFPFPQMDVHLSQA